MTAFEHAAPAEKSGQMVEAVCWECGAKVLCNEFIVCCTGTMFHICPDCEAKVEHSDDLPACPTPGETPANPST